MSKKRKLSIRILEPGAAAEQRPSFCTAAFRRHGIGYLDVILAALSQPDAAHSLRRSNAPAPVLKPTEQAVLCRAAGYGGTPALATLPFASVWYLHFEPAHDADALSDIRLLTEPEKWSAVERGVEESWVPDAWSDWRAGFADLRDVLRTSHAFPSFAQLQAWAARHAERPALESLWHVINEAPAATQLEWYRAASPLYRAHADAIHLEPLLDVGEPEDVVAVTRSMDRWLARQRGHDWVVNTWGTATATQFGWHYLAWRRPDLKNASFVRCRTASSAVVPHQRFRPVSIDVVPTDPIGALGDEKPRLTWASEARKEVIRRFETCLGHDDNFSILVMGPRGIGKTRMVTEAMSRRGAGPLISLNCGSFSDPTHARSELFGHVPGAFTGAKSKRSGAFAAAANGALFLDEVHLLDRGTLNLLLTALQTNTKGEFTFRSLGDEKNLQVKFQPIFGTNRTWPELVETLPLDFLDRIGQRTFELPGIGGEGERGGAWQDVWTSMKFAGLARNPIDDVDFRGWLNRQDLSGNFRDLERIAILVADWQRDEELRTGKLVSWLNREFRRPAVESSRPRSSRGLLFETAAAFSTKPKEFERQCRQEYADAWLKRHGGVAQEAAGAIRRTFRVKFNDATFGRWRRGT